MSSTSAPFEKIKSLSGHSDHVNSLQFSPKGDYLASGGEDARLLIFDTRSWTMEKKYGTVAPIRAIAWHTHPSQSAIISFGLENGIVHTVHTKVALFTCACIYILFLYLIPKQTDLQFEHFVPGHVHCMAFEYHGKTLAVGYNDEVTIARQTSMCK